MTVEELHVISDEIDRSLDSLLSEAKTRLSNIDNRLIQLNEEYKRAKADGDLRENAAYENAIKSIQEAQSDRTRWEVLSDGIVNVKTKIKDYVHQEKITIFSTVYLEYISAGAQNQIEDIESSFTYKLFPYGITDVDNRILSIDSPIGGKLLDKQIGDIIKVRDRSSGRFANFKIIEFY